jgi:hypothetical protein
VRAAAVFKCAQSPASPAPSQVVSVKIHNDYLRYRVTIQIASYTKGYRMSTQFNAVESERLKEEGIEKATTPDFRQELLRDAKSIAIDLCTTAGTVTADDVSWFFETERGIDLAGILGNAMGSLFRGSRWEFTGDLVHSSRKSRHRNLIRVWKFKEKENG